MQPTNQGEVSKLSQVIQLDEGRIQEHLGEVVRSTVEETLKPCWMLKRIVFAVPSGTNGPRAG
jgi:hypothetical protein